MSERLKHYQKRRPKNRGKLKGAQFERTICRRLSLWVSDFQHKDVFWRSAMSGGRSTLAERAGRHGEATSMAGDLSATHPKGHALLALFTVECKFYKDLHFSQFIFSNTGPLAVFWKQAKRNCAKNREPLLILKQNFQRELVGVSYQGLRILRKGARRWKRLRPQAYFPKLDLYIFLLRDVLAEVKFQRVRNYYRVQISNNL